MDSRRRFVLVYAVAALVPFTVFVLLNTNDFGAFVGAYTIIYLIMRSIFKPKMRVKIDIIGLILMALFMILAVQHFLLILGGR